MWLQGNLLETMPINEPLSPQVLAPSRARVFIHAQKMFNS